MLITGNKGAAKAMGFAIAILGFIILPWVVSGYWLRLITSVFMYIVIAKSIDLMMGYTGYVPFGNVVFFGLGAYSSGIAMQYGWPFIPAMLVGALLSAFLCLVVGTPVLRLRGHYFAIATLALNGGVMAIALNTTSITGGAMGLSFPIIPIPPGVLYKYFYFMMFALAIATVLISYLIVRSRFGFAIRSIKADEEAARSLGINTTLYKITTWMITAILTSFAGSIYGYWMSYIATSDVFNVGIAMSAILMVLIGGTGTLLGPLIGAFLFQILSETIWSHFLRFHLGLLGVVTILVIYFIPRGLLSGIQEWLSSYRMKVKKEEHIEGRS